MNQPYNLRNIRQLVNAAYRLEELRQLCYEVPAFRPVYDNFGDERKEALIRHLIEHSERKGLIPRLLSIIQEDVPEKFNEFEGQLGGPSTDTSASNPTDTTTTRTKELIAELMRRLHVLKMQAVRFGISTPPEITIEIEDLERQIDDLQQSLE